MNEEHKAEQIAFTAESNLCGPRRSPRPPGGTLVNEVFCDRCSHHWHGLRCQCGCDSPFDDDFWKDGAQ